MPGRVLVDDDEQMIADLLRAQRRHRGQVASQMPLPAKDAFTVAGTPLTTYTLTAIPRSSDLGSSLVLSLNGLVLVEGTDYTVDYTTAVVTLAATPTTGDVLYAEYWTTGELIAATLPAEGEDPISDASTGNGNGGVTSVHSLTFTPRANSLLVVPAMIYDGDGTAHNSPITASDTLGTLTWTEVTTGYTTNSRGDNFKTSIFWAVAPGSPTAGQVTLTGNNSLMWITIGDVIEVLDGGFNPSTPIAQSAAAVFQNATGDGSGGHTLTATLPSAAGGLVIATLGQHYKTVSAAPGLDVNFTHLHFQTGVSSLEIDVDTAFAFGKQSITWSGLIEGTSDTGFAYWFDGLLVEIQ